MRLWSLHPSYLDQRGLVALWREALLAQAVLSGATRGYTRHPQLQRFRAATDPRAAIAAYLREVKVEADRRGYRFDAAKIGMEGAVAALVVTDGQLRFEGGHLRQKLLARAPAWLAGLDGFETPRPHPLFVVEPGAVAPWEIR